MRHQFGIRTYVAWLLLMPLLVVVVCLEAFLLNARFNDLDSDLLMNGQMIAHQLADNSEYGVFSDNREFLKNITKNALQQADVRAVVILNADTHILAQAGKQPSALSQNNDVQKVDYTPAIPTVEPSAEKWLKFVNAKRTTFDNGKSLLIYQPILTTHVALDDFQSESSIPAAAGAVIIEMSWKQTLSQKSRLLWFTVLATSVALLLAWYLAHLASRRIIKPISALSQAVHAIGAGDLESRLNISSNISELNILSSGINQMAAELQHERAILKHRIDEATRKLQNLAFYDTLTLLPNRRLLNDRLSHALEASQRSVHYGALMFLDLDNFKPLNDKFGHAVGDLLLIEAASRITSCLREEDTVARFGGDEFVVMLNELGIDHADSTRQAHHIAEKIRNSLSASYHLTYQQDDQAKITVEHHCSASIGVVLFLGHHASQECIMNWADEAMYQAKKNGRNNIYIKQNNTL